LSGNDPYRPFTLYNIIASARNNCDAGKKTINQGEHHEIELQNSHCACRRTVIVAFDSLEKAQATFTGAAYREGRKIGDKYAKFRIWAMEGIAK
jgi:uncharacterized protein (DUF1330 family)